MTSGYYALKPSLSYLEWTTFLTDGNFKLCDSHRHFVTVAVWFKNLQIQVSLKRLEIWYLCNYAMAIAYVLISCDLGFDAEIIEELKHLSDVKEAHGIFGAYDILVKVESVA